MTPLDLLLAQHVTFPTKRQEKFGKRKCSATDVEFLHCRFPKGTFENAIEHLPQVRILRVIGGEWEASELFSISKCVHLESLTIDANDGRCFPPDIVSRINAKQLRTLELYSNDDSDVYFELSSKDADAIVAMGQLESLTINAGLTFPASRLSELKQCRNLTYLLLAVQKISDRDLNAAKDDLTKALPDCDLYLYGIQVGSE